MLENRSFDHLLGYSKLPLEGIPSKQSVPLDPDDLSKGSKDINTNGLDECVDDPLHGFDNIANQLNGGEMVSRHTQNGPEKHLQAPFRIVAKARGAKRQ